MIEGYPPPHDHRLQHFKVTPDPGVIEVNIQPASNWNELVDNTTTLYDEARQLPAGDRKIHARRPAHRHRRRQPLRAGRADAGRQPVPAPPRPAAQPGGATGTTIRRCRTCFPACSSARRARPRGSTRPGTTACTNWKSPASSCPARSTCPPWLVDRLFRNLLVDVTGNTHRAEFCIDKLYSPDTASGRLGLVELRGFEMPPHPQMSLTQQLLLRALVGRFWKTPYDEKLVRWGTSLHDRFMLPHFVEQDFAGRARRSGPLGLCLSAGLVRAAFRVPLPVARQRHLSGA